MVATRHPLIDLMMDEPTARYTGMLERKLAIYQQENLRMRCLLELLTGDMWDDYSFQAEDKEIFDLAVDSLVQRCHMSKEDARALCEERWNACNPPEPDPALATYMIGVPKRPPVYVTHARALNRPGDAAFDHKKHLAGLEKIAERKRKAKEG
jgi:hypothetical protein